MGEKNDRLLLFATGGLAIGEAHSEGSVTVTVFGETDFSVKACAKAPASWRCLPRPFAASSRVSGFAAFKNVL
jgi:hypothetical protein